LQLRAQLVDIHAGLEQQRAYAAALAVDHGQQYVGRLHELVVASERERLRIGQRLLKFAGEFVLPHKGGYQKGRLGMPRTWGQSKAVQASRLLDTPPPMGACRPWVGCQLWVSAGYGWVRCSAQAISPTPSPISTTCARLVRGSARRCSPGINPATAI